MKAAVLHEFGDIDTIRLEQIPQPTPSANEVLIEVICAGVNPVDWKISKGILKDMLPHEFPITLGWDVAGRIVQKGDRVTDFAEGDAVFAYCRKKVVHEGSFAQYLCLPADYAVRFPPNLTFAQASCIPLSALTAWQSLFDKAHIQKGETVLIHAGAGGVGSFALQIAKLAQCKVITTTSSSHIAYVQNLGADKVIDYTKEDFSQALLKEYPEGVDVVYDTVGGNTLQKSYALVKPGGRLVTIVGRVNPPLAKNIYADFHLVTPNQNQLKEIADLLAKGKIQPPQIQEFPFEEVVEALRLSLEGHTQGKIVLHVQK